MVHLIAEKRKAEESQAAMPGQMVCWKHDLEKEVLQSTRHAHERNELKKRLAAKKKQLETVADDATNGGYSWLLSMFYEITTIFDPSINLLIIEKIQ
ncbi:hypothetical protein LWI29_034012 [Acer saccharum]|uniref:Uncharacterized protein n=1 Tax=Acer saccharum TaxID=4024 RepID=A0AA39SDH6_ACESA|nr:hypothetical protein LWI29_034012 [Acer saccharum]